MLLVTSFLYWFCLPNTQDSGTSTNITRNSLEFLQWASCVCLPSIWHYTTSLEATRSPTPCLHTGSNQNWSQWSEGSLAEGTCRIIASLSFTVRKFIHTIHKSCGGSLKTKLQHRLHQPIDYTDLPETIQHPHTYTDITRKSLKFLHPALPPGCQLLPIWHYKYWEVVKAWEWG